MLGASKYSAKNTRKKKKKKNIKMPVRLALSSYTYTCKAPPEQTPEIDRVL